MKPRLPDFPVAKLFLSATHTHNAPVTVEGRYALPATRRHETGGVCRSL